MGYFDRTPFIADNDCGGEATSVRITFAAGHEDHRDRRSFAVTVYLDDKEQAATAVDVAHRVDGVINQLRLGHQHAC